MPVVSHIIGGIVFMIIVAYLVVLSLLAWIALSARGVWWVKAMFILTIIVFTVTFGRALNSYSGWPVNSYPPKQSILIAAEVNEPDIVTGDPGYIYLWLVPINPSTVPLGYKPTTGEPRAYKVPYSKQLQQQITSAQPASNSTKGNVQHQIVGLTYDKGKWRAYKLPLPGIPRKTK